MNTSNEKNVDATTTTTVFEDRTTLAPKFDVPTSADDSQGLQTPKSLSHSSFDRLSLIAYDCLLILTPLALIVKCGLCIAASIIDRDSTGYQLDTVHTITIFLLKFNGQLTTIFTIVFVAIVSTLVRRAALWRAQHGTTIGELEQLQASVTLTGTFKSIYLLRNFSLTSLLLTCIWPWYYLGSQASIREYAYREAGPPHHTFGWITNTQGPSYLDEKYFGNVTNAVRTRNWASLITEMVPDTLQGHDKSGNMLIPKIEEFDYKKRDRNGFYKSPNSVTATYHSSSIGLQPYTPFSDFGINSQVVGKLQVNTSYLNVTCDEARVRELSEFPAGVLPSSSATWNSTTSKNSSTSGRGTFDVWYRVGSNDTLIRAISSSCEITQVKVRVLAECNAIGCVAKRLKAVAMTEFDRQQTVFQDHTYAQRFFDELLLASGTPTDWNDNDTIAYQPFRPILFTTGFPDTDIGILTDLQPDKINAFATKNNRSVQEAHDTLRENLWWLARFRSSHVLTPLINNFLIINQQSQGNKLLGQPGIDAYDVNTYDGPVAGPWFSKVELYANYWWPEYKLSVPWILIDLISCGVLLAAGVIAVELRRRTLTPDILAYVSTMTRDNRYFDFPQASSTMDGFTRARLLKDVKVQVVDLQGDEEIGRISLVRTESLGQRPVSKLSKDRLYF